MNKRVVSEIMRAMVRKRWDGKNGAAERREQSKRVTISNKKRGKKRKIRIPPTETR